MGVSRIGPSVKRSLLVCTILSATIITSLANTTALRAASPPAQRAPADVATAERAATGGPSPFPTARTADGREAVADRLIVGFKPGVTDAEKDAVHRAVASAAVHPVPIKRVGDTAQSVTAVGAPSLETLIRAYQADPRVRYAEPDYVVHALGVPNDPDFGQQYGMTKIQAPAAWGVTHGSAAVKIAILDCGIHETHPDLLGKVIARQDFTGSTAGTDDKCNHGTHVAGIASADTNNGAGVAGTGYDTRLLNGKILSDGGNGYDSSIAEGIRWAADNGANVISMSLGGSGACSQTFQDAINYAWSKNVVVVAAAGNSGSNAPFQPADCAHVVAVASTDQTDAKSGFSNYGGWVHVAAPGSTIYSTVNPDLNSGSQYAFFSGTSMATPHVAGLAGLIWSTPWGTSAQAVVQRLESTADQIPGTGTNWQFGRINAMAAVAPAPTPTATGLTPNTAKVGGAPFTLAIAGTNFRTGATVRWNGVSRPALSVTGTQVTVAVTAADLAAAGAFTVAVANVDGAATSPLTFTVVGPPQPATIAPASGAAAGGMPVTIAGAAFQSGATVTFGGAAGTVTSVTSTQIVVTSPAHAAGSVDVVVANPDGQSRTMPNAFAYIAPPAARSAPTAVAATAPAAIPGSRGAPSPAASSGAIAPSPAATRAPLPARR